MCFFGSRKPMFFEVYEAWPLVRTLTPLNCRLVLSFGALALGSMKVAATALVQCWRWLTVARGIGSMLLLAALAQCCCWQHWLNVVAGSIGSMLLLAALAQSCCSQHWLNVVAGSIGSMLLWHDSESYSLFLQNPGCTATPGTKGTQNYI